MARNLDSSLCYPVERSVRIILVILVFLCVGFFVYYVYLRTRQSFWKAHEEARDEGSPRMTITNVRPSSLHQSASTGHRTQSVLEPQNFMYVILHEFLPPLARLTLVRREKPLSLPIFENVTGNSVSQEILRETGPSRVHGRSGESNRFGIEVLLIDVCSQKGRLQTPVKGVVC